MFDSSPVSPTQLNGIIKLSIISLTDVQNVAKCTNLCQLCVATFVTSVKINTTENINKGEEKTVYGAIANTVKGKVEESVTLIPLENVQKKSDVGGQGGSHVSPVKILSVINIGRNQKATSSEDKSCDKWVHQQLGKELSRPAGVSGHEIKFQPVVEEVTKQVDGENVEQYRTAAGSKRKRTDKIKTCPKCNKSIKDRKSFKEHVNIYCGSEPTVECPICLQKFYKPFIVIGHMRRDHGISPATAKRMFPKAVLLKLNIINHVACGINYILYKNLCSRRQNVGGEEFVFGFVFLGLKSCECKEMSKDISNKGDQNEAADKQKEKVVAAGRSLNSEDGEKVGTGCTQKKVKVTKVLIFESPQEEEIKKATSSEDKSCDKWIHQQPGRELPRPAEVSGHKIELQPVDEVMQPAGGGRVEQYGTSGSKRKRTDKIKTCPKCNKSIKDRKSFKEHVNIYCGSEPTVECPICLQKFYKPFIVIGHMRRDHGISPATAKRMFPKAVLLKLNIINNTENRILIAVSWMAALRLTLTIKYLIKLELSNLEYDVQSQFDRIV
ncbi:hypothetical protein NQ317_014981 [Molorchus minor]|uniref:C2H2-type domain-containing protein n=1 Tax=Molorchus minor TaxID=1323400 RepID=A0ABQ9JCE1_9CUCU|nr:hypothetical protein NQ317_014981 [Molorchus minor]